MSHSHFVFLQEEEQLRNSVMFDLLYVHHHHTLAPYIISYYHHNNKVPPGEQRPWLIDANLRLVMWSTAVNFQVSFFFLVVFLLVPQAFFYSLFHSGGMNGFIWLSERNGLRDRVCSPLNGLEDISNNKILWVLFWQFQTSNLLSNCDYDIQNISTAWESTSSYLFSCVARNITFLNPVLHKHIPKPPEGVYMPKKVCKESVICLVAVVHLEHSETIIPKS